MYYFNDIRCRLGNLGAKPGNRAKRRERAARFMDRFGMDTLRSKLLSFIPSNLLDFG